MVMDKSFGPVVLRESAQTQYKKINKEIKSKNQWKTNSLSKSKIHIFSLIYVYNYIHKFYSKLIKRKFLFLF